VTAYPIHHHQDPLELYPHDAALIFIGIDAHGVQHGGIDHAAPAHLDPTRAAADPAGRVRVVVRALARAAAEAAEVHLGAGLGEGEVARAQPGDGLAPEHGVVDAVLGSD